MKKVKKALIPVAGLGTRFLPATKTVPKEMLPVVDKPNLLYIVEECVNSGIEDIVLVAGRQKSAIEDFFDTSYELEKHLEETGKTHLLESVSRIKDLANIISIRQKTPLGLGHAVWSGHNVIGDEPFAVLLGDELMIREEGHDECIHQLIKTFENTEVSSVAVMEVSETEVEKYGIIEKENIDNNLYKVLSVIEKPKADKAPSRLALPGRYVFTPEIFKFLKDAKPGKNGEIQLTDSMTEVAKSQGMVATHFQARRYDTGDKFGYLKANIELALDREDLGPKMKDYLKNLCSQL